MSSLIIEVVVILLLLVVSGVFAMTEMAVVSSRKTRLRVTATSAPEPRWLWPNLPGPGVVSAAACRYAGNSKLMQTGSPTPSRKARYPSQ